MIKKVLLICCSFSAVASCGVFCVFLYVFFSSGKYLPFNLLCM